MFLITPVFEIRAPNVSRIIAGSRAAIEEVLSGAEASVVAAILLVDVIKQLLSQPGTGVVRRRRGIEHQASAPGEPPAPDTGNLRNLVGFQVTGPSRVGIGVQAGAPYWKYQEFGTRFIEPRPFIRPALTIARAGMIEVAANAYRERARRILAGRSGR